MEDRGRSSGLSGRDLEGKEIGDMRKTRFFLPIGAVVAVAAAGAVIAVDLKPDSEALFELAWSVNNQWEGVTYAVKVKESASGQCYILKASPANLTGGPLSDVRMSVAGGDWTDGFNDYAFFTGTGEDMSTVMTAKCDDDGPPGEAEGWALIELYLDTAPVGTLDAGDECIDAMHIHGISMD